MRTLISFFALFLSVALLQLSSGGVGPLDALSGIALGFSTAEIGFLGSAHFAGFFIGCWWAPRLMGSVGHSRAFAAFTVTGAIGLLLHFLIIDPEAWALMRVASGFCVAGSLTVIEAWLQSKLTNDSRGRAMSIYRIVELGGGLGAQLIISVLEPASYVSYNLLALVCCAAILPLTLTKAPQPAVPAEPRLRPMLAVACSPLAVLGVVIAALSSASFRMVGPVYAVEIGLTVKEIAWFLASFILGGALAQFPVGWLADKYDRRWILIWLSIGATLVCIATALVGTEVDKPEIMLLAGLLGVTSFPIFSVSAAHANDFASDEQRVELAAALMFFFAVGAIAAPFVASTLVQKFGPAALPLLLAVGHMLLILYGLGRILVRPTRQDRTRYVYAPRTSFLIGKWLNRNSGSSK